MCEVCPKTTKFERIGAGWLRIGVELAMEAEKFRVGRVSESE